MSYVWRFHLIYYIDGTDIYTKLGIKIFWTDFIVVSFDWLFVYIYLVYIYIYNLYTYRFI
jgi:hypothetical protein